MVLQRNPPPHWFSEYQNSSHFAMIWTGLGDFVRGARYSDHTLEQLGTVVPERNPFYAMGLIIKAAILDQQGRTDDAIPLTKQALVTFLGGLGETNVMSATAYLSLGDQLFRAGQPVEAMRELKQARAIYEQLFGPNSLFVGYATNSMGLIGLGPKQPHDVVQGVAAGSGLIVQAPGPINAVSFADVWGKEYALVSPTAAALHDRAWRQFFSEQYSAAFETLDLALAVVAPNDPFGDSVSILTSKAEFCLFFGNLVDSTRASEEALIRLENTSLQRPLLGIRLEHARSQIRLLTGEIEGCEQRLSASLKEIERLGYTKRPVQGWLLSVMSDMVSISGNTSAALEFNRTALAAFEDALGTDSFVYGFALGGQSELVDESGDAAAGEMILDRGRIILGHFVSPSHLLFYHSNFAKAGFLEDRGRPDEAIRLLASDLAKVIERAGSNNMMVAHAYSRLGHLQATFAPLEAETAYRKMLPIYAHIVGTNNAMYGNALCTVGSFLLGQKRTDEGLAILEAGVEKVRASVGANPATFQKAFRLGYEQLSLPNRSDRGLRLMRESLAGLLRTAGPSDPWAVLFELQLSLAEAAGGNWSNAFSLLSLSLQNQRRQLLEMSLWLSDTEALKDQRMQGWTLLNGFLDSMVLQVPTNEIPNVVSVAATHVAEGKAILEECYKLRHALDQQGETVRTLRKRLGVIDRQLEESQQERFDPKARPAKQLLDERFRLEQDLAGKSQAVKQAMTGTPATHERLVRVLPQDAALIDFVLWRSLPLRTNEPARDQYAAYVTLAGPTTLGRSQVVRVDLGPADPINSLCDQLHVAIAGGRISEQRLRPLLDRLSALLVGPITKVANLHSHWILSPVGQLSRIPFEALRDANTGRHLIEDKRISYVSSGREVVRLAEPKASVPTNAPVVMGFPDFDLPLAATNGELAGPPARPDSAAAFVAVRTPATLSRDVRGHHFDPLPATEREARSATKLLGEDCVLRLAADAREVELKRVVSPRILHLATHGFYLTDQEFRATNSLPDLLASSVGPRFGRRPVNEDWENPLIRCGVALAGANHAGGLTNAAAEDGILTGLEASLLQLQGTELVILSACQTGAGDVRIGEGVMSLRRAFTIAGAQSVLASHWRVSDAATSRLITEFLRHWRAGKPRVEALREAQLSLLRSKEYSSPYFWAAFTLTGQWR